VSIYEIDYQSYEKPRLYKNKYEEYGKQNSPLKYAKKNNMAQILLTHNEGLCNFLIFANSCTPYVINTHTYQFENMKIKTFYKNFERLSAFGIDMSFLYESKANDCVNVIYSPTLSSCEILINNRECVEKIFKEMMEKRQSEPFSFYDFENNYIMNYIYQKDNIRIISDCNYAKIEFYETKPPHSRLILTDQLNIIINTLDSLDVEMLNVDSSSWFSILWNPFKSSKVSFANTSFLVYYQLKVPEPNYNTNYANYSEIPLIGILPIKLDKNIWLSKISKSKSFIYIVNLYSHSDRNDYKLSLQDSIVI
jgi:hypothetical protein